MDNNGDSSLIFQVSLDGETRSNYSVTVGDKADIVSKAYSGHVPDRLDDYA